MADRSNAQTTEKQHNQLPIPQQGDHNARQDQPDTIIRTKRTKRNKTVPNNHKATQKKKKKKKKKRTILERSLVKPTMGLKSTQ